MSMLVLNLLTINTINIDTSNFFVKKKQDNHRVHYIRDASTLGDPSVVPVFLSYEQS